MLKACVIIAIIKMAEIKNHGNVNMINYMPMAYVKIAILINIIKWKDKNMSKINILTRMMMININPIKINANINLKFSKKILMMKRNNEIVKMNI